MNKYHINIFYSDEDECYVADIPDLKGCSALGETPEDAAREIMIAQRLWLEAAKDMGKTIPEPSYTSKRRANKSLEERFEEFYQKSINEILADDTLYTPEDVDWGKPVGREVW